MIGVMPFLLRPEAPKLPEEVCENDRVSSGAAWNASVPEGASVLNAGVKGLISSQGAPRDPLSGMNAPEHAARSAVLFRQAVSASGVQDSAARYRDAAKVEEPTDPASAAGLTDARTASEFSAAFPEVEIQSVTVKSASKGDEAGGAGSAVPFADVNRMPESVRLPSASSDGEAKTDDGQSGLAKQTISDVPAKPGAAPPREGSFQVIREGAASQDSADPVPSGAEREGEAQRIDGESRPENPAQMDAGERAPEKKPERVEAETHSAHAVEHAGGARTERLASASQPQAAEPAHGGVPAREPEAAAQVAKAASQAVDRGETEFHLKLKPDGLGEVSVTVSARDRALNLTIHTSNEAARDEILNQIGTLRSELAAGDYQLGGVSVGVRQDGQGNAPFAGFEHRGEGHSRQPAPGGRESAGLSSDGIELRAQTARVYDGAITYRA